MANPYNNPSAVSGAGLTTYSKKDQKNGLNVYDQFGADSRSQAEQENEDRKKRLAEADAKRAAELAKQPKKAPEPPKRGLVDNILTKVSDFASKVNNATYGTAYDMVKSSIDGAKTTGEVLNMATGNDPGKMKNLIADDRRKTLQEAYDSGKITKERYLQGMEKVRKIYSSVKTDAAKTNIAKKDQAQAAGDVAGTFLDVATLGLGGKVLRQGAKAGTEGAKKMGGAVVDDFLKGAPVGAAYGANDTVRQKGNATTASDLGDGAAVGGLVGGLVGAAAPFVGRVLPEVQTRMSALKNKLKKGEPVDMPPPNDVPVTPVTPDTTVTKTVSEAPKSFAPLDESTMHKTSILKAESDATPVPAGHTRLYQTNDVGPSGIKSDQYFKTPEEVGNFINGRSDKSELKFVDVPDSQVKDVPGKPTVFKIEDAPAIQEPKIIPTVITPKLAQRVRTDAIKKKMIYGFDKTFNDMPEMDRINRKEQFSKATELVLNDPETAMKVAMGQQAAPDGILNNSVWMAAKEYAENTGDVDLMRKLGQSELTSRATGMGQELSMLAEKDPTSAVTKIKELADARRAAVDKRLGKNKTVAKLEQADHKAVKAATPKIDKYDWHSFVESIKC